MRASISDMTCSCGMPLPSAISRREILMSLARSIELVRLKRRVGVSCIVIVFVSHLMALMARIVRNFGLSVNGAEISLSVKCAIALRARIWYYTAR